MRKLKGIFTEKRIEFTVFSTLGNEKIKYGRYVPSRRYPGHCSYTGKYLKWITEELSTQNDSLIGWVMKRYKSAITIITILMISIFAENWDDFQFKRLGDQRTDSAFSNSITLFFNLLKWKWLEGYLRHDISTNDVVVQSYNVIAVWLFFSFNSFYDDPFTFDSLY